MVRIRLEISYDGTEYCGWQVQGRASGLKPSIQSVVEKAVFEVTRQRRSVIASGRTDSGVHAFGQVAHVDLAHGRWQRVRLDRSLNAVLPEDVRILKFAEVSKSYHARFSSDRKAYVYYVQTGPCALPHLRKYTTFIEWPIQWDRLKEAARDLVGDHDFSAFKSSDGKPGHARREIFEVRVDPQESFLPKGFYVTAIRVVGSGFLKQMVRSIVGTLLDVGRGRLPPDRIKEVLKSPDRRRVGITAPPQGLWLEEVWGEKPAR